MSMPNQSWDRLVAAARQAPQEADAEAPFGFATRVVALSRRPEGRGASIFGRYSLRALGVASILAVASVAANYSAIATAFSDDQPVAVTDDPVSEVVAIAS